MGYRKTHAYKYTQTHIFWKGIRLMCRVRNQISDLDVDGTNTILASYTHLITIFVV